MANLRWELRNAVRKCFKENTKKREYKREHGRKMDATIFSYKTRDALLDRAGELAKFIESHHPEVHHVKEIKNMHIREYLENKQKGCTKATVATYQEQIKKLAKCCNKAYKSVNVQWASVSVAERPQLEDRLRQDAMTAEQFRSVLEASGVCGSRNGIRLGRAFGLRVQEIPRIRVTDVDLLNNTLKIYRSKGGRTWQIPVETDEQRELLKELIEGKRELQQLIPVRAESLNKYLHKMNERVGNKNLLEQKTGFHAIRKLVAQERYNGLRKSGMCREEALNEVNKYLGHGDDRRVLSNTYVNNQW
ncbi:MAG: tyrosine-type recombinase/integrase [Lacrimispora sp.]|uniref:tyrosine-type recombinase/integrase n=1 Tax=Lacrimispora sp. TaxID=2719234 RepID=UPI0039E368D7